MRKTHCFCYVEKEFLDRRGPLLWAQWPALLFLPQGFGIHRQLALAKRYVFQRSTPLGRFFYFVFENVASEFGGDKLADEADALKIEAGLRPPAFLFGPSGLLCDPNNNVCTAECDDGCPV